MSVYLVSLILGAAGLLGMAATGLGRHGHGGAAGGGSHGGHGGHGGHHGGAHAGTYAGSHSGASAAAHGAGHGGAVAATWLLMTPRFLFALLLGFGIAGVLLQSLLGGIVLLAAAVAGAVIVERALVNPLWKLALRFASNPATTLDGAIESDAVAVSNFDRNGQGIIAVEVDGQVQQVLATLCAADQAAGARVRAGQRVRIDEVDGERQRCSVSLL
jgi:hypothetical protein